MQKFPEKKFPISINNNQCIGPCYEPNTYILHPISLKHITHIERPFCPTQSWIDNNGNMQEIDTCLVATDKLEIDQNQINMSFVIPTFYFNCEVFLKTYYDIYSFDDALDWITHNKAPLYTNLRIINCAWKVYGLSIDIINDNLIDFYINLIKKEWIKNIYPFIAHYITIDNKNIYFMNNDQDIEKNSVEKINFIIKKFNNKEIIYKVIQSYIDKFSSDWSKIDNHNINIENHLINFLENKIIKTINNSNNSE